MTDHARFWQGRGDAATLMLASVTDREGALKAISDMIEGERWSDLGRVAIAAIDIGGELVQREADANGRTAVGPVLDYLTAMQRTAAKRGAAQ